MNRKSSFLLGLGSMLFFATGCKKAEDYLEQHPDAEYKACQILKITADKEWHVATFTYNKYGDPENITFDVSSTERPNYLFKYDKNRRLSECITYFNQGNVFFWSKFFYDKKGMIISDSTFAYGFLVNGEVVTDPDADNYYELRAYTYDQQKRIKSIRSRNSFAAPGSPDNITEFNYDARGNQQYSPAFPLVYDNKVNLRRTNKIFMFIDRDYSRNNLLGPLTYNADWLPLTFNSNENMIMMGVNLKDATVTYRCNNQPGY